MDAMTETTEELEDRVVAALKANSMSREQAVAEFQKAGWTRALALDFVSVIVDGKGE